MCGCVDLSVVGIVRTGKEAVKLHEELEVHIVALGRLAVRGLNVVTVEIDTCGRRHRQPESSGACSNSASSLVKRWIPWSQIK